VKPSRWFLPDSQDLLGLLSHQLDVTISGLDAFAAWAAGDSQQGEAVHALEHQADQLKLEFARALQDAFVTPLEPEDLFALSRGIDWVLNHAKDVVGESELMACPPDDAVAEMAALLASAMRSIGDAVGLLRRKGADPLEAVDRAVKGERQIEKAYRRAMAALLDVDDLREVIARRELYRRCSRIGETVVEVAERVAYAVAKES
jgi:uncharacterized protein Yka (UPF0111/DUF47 family)